MSSEEDNNSFDEISEEETAGVSEDSELKAEKHAKQLERLQEKDPEFYQFLKEHDNDLLEFDDDDDEEEEDNDEDVEDDKDGADEEEDADPDMDATEQKTTVSEKGKNQAKKVITAAMVDGWCTAIREESKLSAVQSLMRAFRTACHYGDEAEDGSGSKFSIMSSSVFNKIMLVVLSDMDGILRGLLKMPTSGGKKETVLQLMSTKPWKNYNHIVKSYLGNALHVLNQMTDAEMIAYTLRRLKFSAVFLAAFPSLLRKYMKVSLHFWGTGGGALPVVAFLFIRDLCIRLGSDCLDECFKGIYKAYVMNCQFVNATKLQHIQFLGNCIIELYGVDLPTAYQHAFVFIRQLAMILREALSMKTKETFRKVYEWKFMNCLELWTGAVCAYSSEPEFRPLAYPLTQIISGASRLVPTARYFPLRLRCARMLNRIAASTGTFIPVSLPLLDMLEMKELNRPPTGGVGKAIDLRTILKVSKPILKTRGFQEACVFSVIEELGEHLSQWSYSIAFFELAFIPALRLRSFCKSTKIERFRRETRELIRQIEANSAFTNAKRATVTFLPNDPAAESFLEDEKKLGVSPLSRYAITLHQKAKQKTDLMSKDSAIVGARSSVFGKNKSDSDEEDHSKDAEEGSAVFSSSWLPRNDSKTKTPKEKKSKKNKKQAEGYDGDEVAVDEDIVGELVLSSDEDDDNDDMDKRSMSDSPSEEEDQEKSTTRKHVGKKRKLPTDSSKKGRFHNKKPKRKPNSNKKSLNR